MELKLYLIYTDFHMIMVNIVIVRVVALIWALLFMSGFLVLFCFVLFFSLRMLNNLFVMQLLQEYSMIW